MGKHFKVSSSTKWRLGQDVVLWLMECLTSSVSFEIFTDNYFTSFCLLALLEVNNIWATRLLNKNRLSRYTIIGDKQLQKRNVATLNSAYQAKKECNFNSGWSEQQQGGLHSFFCILWTSEISSVLKQSWKKIYSRAATQSVPLLQPEHGFCQ